MIYFHGNVFLFWENHDFLFPIALMGCPWAFNLLENQLSKTMLHAARQEAFFGTPSLREASRKHQHKSAIKCITEINVPHKVTA